MQTDKNIAELIPQAARWLENAKVDAAGRYYIVPELTYKNFDTHKNWNPCFYIVTNDMKLRRIGLALVKELVARGKAIEIDKLRVLELRGK